MAENKNQHYVPRSYFRRFRPANDERINILIVKAGKTHLGTRISEQCSEDDFYGEGTNESNLIAEYEGKSLTAINQAIAMAWGNQLAPFDRDALIEAVMFQHKRTFQKFKDIWNQRENTLKFMKENEAPNDLIARWQSNKEDERELFIKFIDVKKYMKYVRDLRGYIITNHTQQPFIFSDSPSIFHNAYREGLDDMGSDGYSNPGLQMFMPLDAKTMVAFFDPEAYTIEVDIPTKGRGLGVVELKYEKDVSSLNELQIHHCISSVYFGEDTNEAYVNALWQANKDALVKYAERHQLDELETSKPTPFGNAILATYKLHPNVKLRLSFVTVKPNGKHDRRHSRHNGDKGPTVQVLA